LIQDSSGNLYGTTVIGGQGYNAGTVFKIAPSSKIETLIHGFTPWEACFPVGIVMDAQGNLFGATEYCGANGFGTVFKIDTAGVTTVLYNFHASYGGSFDGEYPLTSPVLDAHGNLYGSTEGSVYKLTATGDFTLLHYFGSGEGDPRWASPTLDAEGNVYGTTCDGGTYGRGSFFKITPSGLTTVLYSFSGGSDGAGPCAGLLRNEQGDFYGITISGGTFGYGTIFRLKP
jgi:uncharacterized repeat protein (TIGR03803 family)